MERHSLDTLAAAWAQMLGVMPPAHAAEANPQLTAFVKAAFEGKNVDRIVLYNPDAIAQWLCEKYPDFMEEVTGRTHLTLPLYSPMPPKTPVCFGTMYTGAQPEVHGIQKYEKPVITIDTLFDALIRAGKKPVILSYGTASMSHIFNERQMDYYFFEDISQVNAKVVQLILEDKYDVYMIYNGNYDTIVHDRGPEDLATLGELRINAHVFGMLHDLIKANWSHHRTLLGFCPDHGCHLVRPGKGSHGLDIPEDREIFHFYETL